MLTAVFILLSPCPFPHILPGIYFSSSASLSKQNGYQELATLVQILGLLFENTILFFSTATSPLLLLFTVVK